MKINILLIGLLMLVFGFLGLRSLIHSLDHEKNIFPIIINNIVLWIFPTFIGLLILRMNLSLRTFKNAFKNKIIKYFYILITGLLFSLYFFAGIIGIIGIIIYPFIKNEIQKVFPIQSLQLILLTCIIFSSFIISILLFWITEKIENQAPLFKQTI